MKHFWMMVESKGDHQDIEYEEDNVEKEECHADGIQARESKRNFFQTYGKNIVSYLHNILVFSSFHSKWIGGAHTYPHR